MNENLCLTVSEPVDRKAYSAPAVIHELRLETRAGSPLPGFPEPLDPLGLDPTQPRVE